MVQSHKTASRNRISIHAGRGCEIQPQFDIDYHGTFAARVKMARGARGVNFATGLEEDRG